MRNFIIVLLVGFTAAPTNSRILRGSIPPTTINAYDLKIGAGGYITGMSISSDNTYVARTDVFGAYIWNPSATSPQGNVGGTGAWQQLIRSDTMPAAFTSSGQQLYSDGVYEVAISPSNSNYIFMVYFNPTSSSFTQIYFSSNKGQTWTATNFASSVSLTYGVGGTIDPNTPSPNAITRVFGPKMVVDPNSCGTSSTCTVYAGMATGGLWKTTDSGSTWTKLTNFPTPTANSPGITGVAVNPANSLNVFAASSGNGVYQSADGGSTWNIMSAGVGPAILGYGVASGNGNYYACEPTSINSNNSNTWVWAAATWTKAITVGGAGNSCAGIAVSPSNNNWIRVVNVEGGLVESTNGTTFGSFSDSGTGGVPVATSLDVPWLAAIGSGGGTGGTEYGLLWDQANPAAGKMIFPSSRGVWTNTVAQGFAPSTTTHPASQSVGIEELASTQIILPPNGGATPITCNWDSAIFQPNLTQYPSSFLPTTGLAGCWALDYVPATPVTQYVINADDSYIGGGHGYSAICTIGGSCTLFSAIGAGLPANVYPNNTGAGGGDIAAADANHILLAGSANAPYFTANGGTSWTQVSIAGIASWSSFAMSPFGAKPTHLTCADKVGATTFYINYSGNGLYHSTDGGTTWTLSSNSASIPGGAGSQMHCTPPLGAGNTVAAGDVWIAAGAFESPGGHPASSHLVHVTGANTGTPTITTCANVQEPYDIGFGVPKSGNTYPSIYIAGWVGASPVWGIWRSDDQCSTWTKIDDFPNNSLDRIKTIAGDPNSWNKVYFGFDGSGYAMRQY